jgi:hypothetical protein
MSHLVGFTPALLGFWQALVDQNSLAVREKEGLEVELFNCIAQQGRPCYHLLSSNHEATDNLTKNSVLSGGIVMPIKPQKLTHLFQSKRRLRIPEAPKNFGDLSINVLGRHIP